MSIYSLRDAFQHTLESHLREVGEFTADLAEEVRTLPERMRHWTIGEEETTHAVVLDTWNGDVVRDDSWLECFDREQPDGSSPNELRVMLPNAAAFAHATFGVASAMTRAGGRYERTRILTAGGLPKEAPEQLSDFLSSGGETRLHTSLPLFFCVDAHAHVAIADGGDASTPGKLVFLHSPLLAGIAHELFDRLWTTGHSLPHRKNRHEWSALLRLLYRGETLDSASRRLGITPRTARRRLDAAYLHYGVSTLFALGAAWGANVAEAPPVPDTGTVSA